MGTSDGRELRGGPRVGWEANLSRRRFIHSATTSLLPPFPSLVSRLILRLLLVAAVLGGLPAGASLAQSYNAPHTAVLPAPESATIFVHAMTGRLRIEGRPDTDSIRISGSARAFSTEDADNASLGVERDGATIHLRPSVPEPIVGTPRFDLTLTVPPRIALRLEGGPGPLDVQNVRSVSVESWTGDAKLRDVSGNVAVSRIQGDLRLQRVGGEVRVLDGEGRLNAQGLEQGLTIEQHTAGRLTVGRSAGAIVIGDHGAGDIEIYEIDGGVHIKADGAGHIQIRQISQGLRVDQDRGGRIRHTGVAGSVQLP